MIIHRMIRKYLLSAVWCLTPRLTPNLRQCPLEAENCPRAVPDTTRKQYFDEVISGSHFTCVTSNIGGARVCTITSKRGLARLVSISWRRGKQFAGLRRSLAYPTVQSIRI